MSPCCHWACDLVQVFAVDGYHMKSVCWPRTNRSVVCLCALPHKYFRSCWFQFFHNVYLLTRNAQALCFNEWNCNNDKNWRTTLRSNIVKPLQVAPNPKTEMVFVSSHSCLCAIHWIQVLNREWSCSWSNADRRCSNYIWVINNFIA